MAVLVHFTTFGGTKSQANLTWKYAHQPSNHSEQKAKGHKGPGTSGRRGGVTKQQRTLMATGPLVQQMTTHVAGTSSSDAAPLALLPAAPAVSAAPLPTAPLPTDEEEVLLGSAAAAPVAPSASAAAAASSAADPAPTVSSVAEAADYAALTGRQIEAVELLLEHHKRARAAGTAQGLLPLNVLPERAGGESM
jgi:hypothetical protein